MASKRFRVEKRDSVRNTRLKAAYGISLEQYESLKEKQKGQCAICNKTARLFVDHDHTTGLIRGLLCTNCNVMLGQAADNKETLISGANYLERNSGVL